MSGIALKACAVWLAILGLAIANGVFREAMLRPSLGRAPSLVLSGLLLSGLIVAATYVSLPWLGVRTPRELLTIGAGWLVLTLAFEFSFGWLRGKPLAQVLEAYTFREGNIWPVVLLVTALSPWVAAKLRGWF